MRTADTRRLPDGDGGFDGSSLCRGRVVLETQRESGRPRGLTGSGDGATTRSPEAASPRGAIQSIGEKNARISR